MHAYRSIHFHFLLGVNQCENDFSRILVCLPPDSAKFGTDIPQNPLSRLIKCIFCTLIIGNNVVLPIERFSQQFMSEMEFWVVLLISERSSSSPQI